MTDPNTRRALTLSIDRILKAPRQAVWRCWTEPALLMQWYCPQPWTVPEVDIELRPGGRFNLVMQGPDCTRMDIVGTWLEIVPQRRLVFTDAYAEDFWPRPDSFMTGTVDLSDAADGPTRMVWSARHARAEDVVKHREMGFEPGWNAAADQVEVLARTL